MFPLNRVVSDGDHRPDEEGDGVELLLTSRQGARTGTLLQLFAVAAQQVVISPPSALTPSPKGVMLGSQARNTQGVGGTRGT